MPEGDTIHRAAHRLGRALVGGRITRFESPLPELANAGLEGHRVASVTANGKNLLITFDDERVLHTHMRMNGAWHIYRPSERWRKAEHGVRVILEVTHDAGDGPVGDAAFVAICFLAPVVRLLRRAEGDARLERLGPDILDPAFDTAEAVAGLRALNDRALGDALLDQTALAGIGNIYKSESLFACRLDPFARVASFDDAALTRVVDEARRMMRRNTLPSSHTRITTTRGLHGARYAVYKRSGSPCFVCGGRIAMERQGVAKRSTYYCPTCQPPRRVREHTPAER